MCGRYVNIASTHDLTDQFDVVEVVDEVSGPNWNTAPTDLVPGVLMRHPRGKAKDAPPVRQLRALRWGLVPSWSKSASGGAKMINARIETLASKPAFRTALRKRRLILPASGYYEWMPVEDGTGRVRKQPYYIHPPAEDRLLTFAGLYEWWRDDSKPDGAEDAWLLSCTIVTTAATGPLGEIHDRTPFVLPPDRIAAWLDPAVTEPSEVEKLLAPTRIALDARLVSTAVNKVGTNGAELIAAVGDAGDEPTPLETVGAAA